MTKAIYTLEFDNENRKVIMRAGPTYNTIMMDDIIAYTSTINSTLLDDPTVSSYLPVSSDIPSLDLFSKLSDGKVLAALINHIEPSTIDMRVLDYSGKSEVMKKALIRENIVMVLNSLPSVGVHKGNISVQNFVEYRDGLNRLCSLLWQLLKKIVLQNVDLRHNNNLARLLLEGESLDKFMDLDHEKILKRWVNYQLARAGSSLRMENLGKSLADGMVYVELLNHIGQTTALDAAKGVGSEERARMVVAHAKERYAVDVKVSSKFITSGLDKVNTIFLASIFNANPFLEDLEKKIELEEDSETDAVKKSIRNWMQSMLPGEVIDDIYRIAAEGVLPLKIIDSIKKTVRWERVKMAPKNRYQMINNCEEMVEAAKKALDLGLVGVHGQMIEAGNKKIVHDFFLVVMVFHCLSILRNTEIDGKKVTENVVKGWSKEKVLEVRGDAEVDSYASDGWKNGLAMIALIEAVKPAVVEWSYVQFEGAEEKDKIRNVSYALTIARKLGAVLFCGPESFVRGSTRMTLLFCIEMMKISKGK